MSQTSLNKIEDIFTALGGKFIISPKDMKNALSRVKCFVFDWDGVFCSGKKGEKGFGSFSEPDSMGINLLRYGFYLINNELPFISIITGESNKTAEQFAKREHFSLVYSRIKDKKIALSHLCKTESLNHDQISFVYDDVNDLSMAKDCGLKIQVNRDSSPLFKRFTLEHSFCDYRTGYTGEQYAVREVCELLLGLMEVYDKVVKNRAAFDQTYCSYLKAKNRIKPQFFFSRDGHIYEGR